MSNAHAPFADPSAAGVAPSNGLRRERERRLRFAHRRRPPGRYAAFPTVASVATEPALWGATQRAGGTDLWALGKRSGAGVEELRHATRPSAARAKPLDDEGARNAFSDRCPAPIPGALPSVAWSSVAAGARRAAPRR